MGHSTFSSWLDSMLAHESVLAVDTVLLARRFDSTRDIPGERPTDLMPPPWFLEDASTQSLLDRKRRRAGAPIAAPRALPVAMPPPSTDRRLPFEYPHGRKGARFARLALGRENTAFGRFLLSRNRTHDTSMGTGTSPVILGDRLTKLG
jgi:hypothetical protein